MTKKNVSLKMGIHKDRKGGLTKEGISYYNRKTGSNLKPGVTWTPKTSEDFRRKGSFLTRFYGQRPIPPLKKPNGDPTRYALAACLHYNSSVLLANGETLSIGFIVENKLEVEVVCLDTKTNRLTTSKVTNWGKSPSNYKEFITIRYKSSNYSLPHYLTLTKDHLILTKEEGWVESNNALGKTLYYYDEPIDKLIEVPLTKIFNPEDIYGYSFKYDIEVEEHHNFIANGIVVHNSKWGEPVPSSASAVSRLYAKGKALLERYKRMKENKTSKENDSSTSQDQLLEAQLFQELLLTNQLEFNTTPEEEKELEETSHPEFTKILEDVEYLSQNPSINLELLSNSLLKIPIAIKGNFFRSKDKTIKFSDKDYKDIITNFKDNSLGFKPYGTYGHYEAPTGDLLSSTLTKVIEEAKSIDYELKAGDILDIKEEDEVLYAYLEPKEELLEIVKDRGYEYASGEFLRNFYDKNTGEKRGTALLRLALTNSPFLPFKDKKIEIVDTLSTNTNNSADFPQFVDSFVIKLTSNIDYPKEMSEELQQQLQKQLQDLAESFKSSEAKRQEHEVQFLSTLTSISERLDKTSEEVKSTQESLGSVKEELSNTLQSVKTELDTKLSEVEGKVKETKALSEHYSTSLRTNAQNHLYSELFNQGVPPAIIKGFKQVEEALLNDSEVVKLSTGSEEKEVSLREALAGLLVEAVKSDPVDKVNLSQKGSTTFTAPTTVLGVALKGILEKNKKAS